MPASFLYRMQWCFVSALVQCAMTCNIADCVAYNSESRLSSKKAAQVEALSY